MPRLVPPAFLLAALVVSCSVPSQAASKKEDAKKTKKDEDAKKTVDDGVTWDKADLVKRLDKEFDLKLKDWKVVDKFTFENEDIKGKHVRMLLEFKKEVDPKKWNASGQPFTWGASDSGPYLEFFYFDEENVRILAQKHTNILIDGDITHKKSEAFRVFLPLAEASYLSRTKRIEVYLRIPAKKADKGK